MDLMYPAWTVDNNVGKIEWLDCRGEVWRDGDAVSAKWWAIDREDEPAFTKTGFNSPAQAHRWVENSISLHAIECVAHANVEATQNKWLDRERVERMTAAVISSGRCAFDEAPAEARKIVDSITKMSDESVVGSDLVPDGAADSDCCVCMHVGG